GRDHALLPASEEGDARLLRHVRAAHLHRVHEAERRRHQMSRRRPVAPRSPRRRDEAESDPEDPARWSRYSPRGYPGCLDHLEPSAAVADLRCGRLRRGNPDQPSRGPQRRSSGHRRLRRRHGDTVPGMAGAGGSRGFCLRVRGPRGDTSRRRRRPGEPPVL
ncbi:MAG: Rhomboid family membrane protein, partial [uncultured Rubrobacteraceae bacterium]